MNVDPRVTQSFSNAFKHRSTCAIGDCDRNTTLCGICFRLECDGDALCASDLLKESPVLKFSQWCERHDFVNTASLEEITNLSFCPLWSMLGRIHHHLVDLGRLCRVVKIARFRITKLKGVNDERAVFRGVHFGSAEWLVNWELGHEFGQDTGIVQRAHARPL